MIGGKGHSIEMDTDAVLAALRKTRTLRMALDVLWGQLPIPLETDQVRAIPVRHRRLPA
jgi:hypothetical protein